MMNVLSSLIVGICVGIFFSIWNLPIPAPSNLAGILGIVGIFLGMLIINFLRKYA